MIDLIKEFLESVREHAQKENQQLESQYGNNY